MIYVKVNTHQTLDNGTFYVNTKYEINNTFLVGADKEIIEGQGLKANLGSVCLLWREG